jgi:acyl-coenzyme A thioesterase PaaI-like protein
MSADKAFQDYYPESLSYCYGCGRLNEHGLQIKSYRENGEAIRTFQPAEYHMALPGYVYGGLIASLIDCHGTGTDSGASYQAAGRELGSEPVLRFLTASLHVDYLKPTPLGGPLELRAQVQEIRGRKVVVTASLYAHGFECARGEVVAVQVPEAYLGELGTGLVNAH